MTSPKDIFPIDPWDGFIQRGLKNWLSRHKPPVGGRADLLAVVSNMKPDPMNLITRIVVANLYVLLKRADNFFILGLPPSPKMPKHGYQSTFQDTSQSLMSLSDHAGVYSMMTGFRIAAWV